MMLSPHVQARKDIADKIRSAMTTTCNAQILFGAGIISKHQYFNELDNVLINTAQSVAASIFVVRTEPSMN